MWRLGGSLIMRIFSFAVAVGHLAFSRCSLRQVVGDVSQVNLGADLSGLTFEPWQLSSITPPLLTGSRSLPFP